MNPAAFVSLILIIALLIVAVRKTYLHMQARKRIIHLEQLVFEYKQKISNADDIDRLKEYWSNLASRNGVPVEVQRTLMRCKEDLEDLFEIGMLRLLLERSTRNPLE